MLSIKRNLSIRMKGNDVKLLHKELEKLGHPIPSSEIEKYYFGSGTRNAVMEFQEKYGLRKSGEVDKSTIAKMNQLLETQPSLPIPPILEDKAGTGDFRVSGKTLREKGVEAPCQMLMSFNVNLVGAAIYNTVQSIEELKNNGGFEEITETKSDRRARYTFIFTWNQFKHAESKKADIVVFALEGKEIIGRSRLVNSNDYIDTGEVRNLDVNITGSIIKIIEYENLIGRLDTFLAKSKVKLKELATSNEQIIFTAGELDEDHVKIRIAAEADVLSSGQNQNLSHELLYGIGRDEIRLTWPSLFKKNNDELNASINKAIDGKIIRKYTSQEIETFLGQLHKIAIELTLDYKSKNQHETLETILSYSLPNRDLRIAFMSAVRNYQGNPKNFWKEYLPKDASFKNKPDLIQGILLTQQLMLLTRSYTPLVKELQVTRKTSLIIQLLELTDGDWEILLKKTGVPDNIPGKDVAEKAVYYAEKMKNLLYAAYPTQKVALMVKNNEIAFKDARTTEGIKKFYKDNASFNIASSRIHEFDKEIKEASPKNQEGVKNELLRMQRIFQVSTSPGVMSKLMEKNLNSAHTIASTPEKSFVKMYGKDLGGDQIAYAVHQRATYINTRANHIVINLRDWSHGFKPKLVMSEEDHKKAEAILLKQIPNYTELIGSPDLCECEDCRSIFSPAAYFVDLMRFLSRGATNDDDPPKSPLDIFKDRRPDLYFLPLTCENTTTEIPYIDLINEVLEYCTAKDGLDENAAHDTGEATKEELRANPQNIIIDAYIKLKASKNPFTLPYHQPLDVIRTYSDYLNVSRYEVMKAIKPKPDPASTVTKNAIEAESLKISPEEYIILTGKAFGGTTDSTPLCVYYGYDNAEDFANIQDETDADGNPRGIRVLLERTGLIYTELVELVKTLLINPYQGTLDFLENIFSYASIGAKTFYNKFGQIKDGTLDPANDSNIKTALINYNSAEGTSVTPDEFKQWVIDNLDKFKQVITLYEPNSKCKLETTQLRTIQSIYEGSPTSGITDSTWSKIHRFIRLWRKLGWTMHETDLMLAALGEDDITPATISKLESVLLMKSATKRPLNELAVLWGNIDTYGEKSLYKKLFLNKAVQQIDEAFKADAFGNYLQRELDENGDPITLAKLKLAILAAFRITEEELNAIFEVAKVVDGGNRRTIDIDTDILNLQNLSIIYRHVVLANALKIKVADLCKLICLFGASPFSIWDIQQKIFTNISPADTYEFYKLATSTKTAGFKPSVLEYILQGTFPTDSAIGLDKAKTFQTVKAIRSDFTGIEQDNPETPVLPLTAEILTAKLSLTFQPEIAGRFMRIVEGTESFETMTDPNLNVTIADDLADKYTYINGSGRLTCAGVMSDTEQNTLKGLANANDHFRAAVKGLYEIPETFVSDNFNGVFSNLATAKAVLIDHPSQATAASFDQKLIYVYENYLPVLKNKLRRDAITKHIAALIGLSEEATALLIAIDIDELITKLSNEGFSFRYFTDTSWTTPEPNLDGVDITIDFPKSNNTVPDLMLATHPNFSTRWRAYMSPPANGEYTLVVSVEQPSDAFNLYLDDLIILNKNRVATNTSWEYVVTLNASQMYLLTLEYTHISGEPGIHLYWKTATKGLEIVPSSSAYPANILEDFVTQATVFHRSAKFILGFKIGETELNHFIKFNIDFDNINFKVLTGKHWKRINDYMGLRNAVPQAQALLTDVFALANRSNPKPTMEKLKEILNLATNWDRDNLKYLVDAQFNLHINDFKNEIALKWIYDVMQIVSKTGISAQTIAIWGATETNFDELNKTAQLIKNTVKAKYEHEDWLEIAGSLSDKIREKQKQALISYLLTTQKIKDAGVEDADGLFEYFLIDVQMGACMDTSRIVQANSAIQLFITRCLLNLESNISNGKEIGVAPDSIDRNQWEWMKNYRLWEANRKIFCYPENWLEPEWRDDKSPFFKDFESELTQNDITERSVGNAFRNYLFKLNEVANLDVSGMYQDKETETIHVFARTHNAPYQYYYRRWNKNREWSAWEKVDLDIRSIDDGDNSGVHLIPVVWKKRLFLFWPEFLEKQEASVIPANDDGSEKSIKQLADEKSSNLKPDKYWEVRLAWSEWVDSKWTPKQLTKEFDKLYHYLDINHVAGFTFYLAADSWLYIASSGLQDPCYEYYFGKFVLPSDIQSQVTVENVGLYPSNPSSVDLSYMKYSNFFMKHKVAYSSLILENNAYLLYPKDHKILFSHQYPYFNSILNNPFFYHDAYRTYFVRPVDTEVVKAINDPGEIDPSIFKHFFEKVEEIFPPFPGGPAYDMKDNILVDPNARELRSYSNTYQYGNVPAYGAMKAMINQSSQKMMAESKKIAISFGGMTSVNQQYGNQYTTQIDKGLEFYTFYHPFASKFVSNLNEYGLDGLMQSDTTIPGDNGETFFKTYYPNFDQGYVVPKPADLGTHTYYKENVCFDVYAANSIYNWELFFHAPLYIATRLSKNGKFAEAMKWFHYIFDPTTDEQPLEGHETSRYWKVLPFKAIDPESLEDWFLRLRGTNEFTDIVSDWRDNPFLPHLIARYRPIAYMTNVVIKYVENLIAWGDQLFRRDTWESINEALQIYVLANHILGPRPQFIPKRGKIKAETYASLEGKLDDFSNALVQIENIFPYSNEVSVAPGGYSGSLLGVAPAFYFCIPGNERLLKNCWDTVADRLYKIRHCMNIEGVERRLALFAPEIEPGLLVQAIAQGLDLGSILADLSSPPPIYRFTYLMQKANEFCAEVKSLGSALLSTLEKKDGEEVSRLRATHETAMLELMTHIKERQVLEANANKDNLLKSRETGKLRWNHYVALLQNESIPVPLVPTISETLSADSQLPADTVIPTVEVDVDKSLVDSDERGVKLIPREKEELTKNEIVKWTNVGISASETIAAIFNLFPTIEVLGSPLGVGAGTDTGGFSWAGAISAAARAAKGVSDYISAEAILSAKMASYIRREQDWTLQANLAAREIVQLDKQIIAADIRIQVAEKELENHIQQIENAQEVEQFLKEKFTNQELYQWMKEQLFAVYKQSYNMAYDMAKKAEKAYKYETGSEMGSFIQYGYWDNTYQGLMSGERLQLALKQMDKSYLEENRRELELTKHISLAIWNPLELQKLKETGQCYINIPEELFDFDFQGHYFRRIKAARISIPCVVGPYTTVNCTLRLLKNTIRVNTAMNEDGEYEHNNDEGIWIDDDRFRSSNVIVKAIATSTAQNDAGIFELNFRDERYLPFEGAGAISEWKIELTSDIDLRQFDYSTISDTIIHLSYTAREDVGPFKDEATKHIKNFLGNVDDLSEQPLMRMFSLKHEFPTEWNKFLHPGIVGSEQILTFTIGKKRMPFFSQHRIINTMKLDILAKTTQNGDYHLLLSIPDINDNITKSSDIPMPQIEEFGNLQTVSLTIDDQSKYKINVEDINIDKPISLWFSHSSNDYTSLNPDEVKDILLVMHYKLNGQ